MRLRRPDPFVVALVVALVLVLVAIGPCADPPSSPSSSGYRVTTPAASPIEARLFMADPTTTSTSTSIVFEEEIEGDSATRGSLIPPSSTEDLGVFKVTCYGPPMFPAGQTTASGDPVGPGSIAVDPRVIPMGTRLEVEGYGRGVANDRGGAVRGRHVDVWRADPYHDCPIRSARVRVISP